ncbi:HepT-like ribonuclease domain-containing protein [Cellulomonas soli]|uniref:HepT-like ribonuclease domain-containing protein n=1 Tax=Cellulomonas soli TaxID=931535 RepID=UPI003F85A7E5
MSRTSEQRLRDVLEAIDAIDRADMVLRAHGPEDELALVALDAIQYRIMTIGEAVKALPLSLRDDHPDVPWSDIARMRDLIGHHYYRLDAQVVRATIQAPIAQLRESCQAALDAG